MAQSPTTVSLISPRPTLTLSQLYMPYLFLLYLTESFVCHPDTQGNRATHQSLVNPPGTMPMEKPGSLLPISHQLSLSLALQLGFYQLDTSCSHLGRGNLEWEIFRLLQTVLEAMPMMLFRGYCLWGRAQTTVGSAIPRQTVLCLTRKQTEWELESKPVSNSHRWSLF